MDFKWILGKARRATRWVRSDCRKSSDRQREETKGKGGGDEKEWLLVEDMQEITVSLTCRCNGSLWLSGRQCHIWNKGKRRRFNLPVHFTDTFRKTAVCAIRFNLANVMSDLFCSDICMFPTGIHLLCTWSKKGCLNNTGLSAASHGESCRYLQPGHEFYCLHRIT